MIPDLISVYVPKRHISVRLQPWPIRRIITGQSRTADERTLICVPFHRYWVDHRAQLEPADGRTIRDILSLRYGPDN